MQDTRLMNQRNMNSYDIIYSIKVNIMDVKDILIEDSNKIFH